jgi:hypothetical protein
MPQLTALFFTLHLQVVWVYIRWNLLETNMIHPKYQSVVFAFFMALLMSCLMSLVITVHNIGLVPDILWIWLDAWAFAFLVAFPAVMLVAPLVRKIVVKLIRLP